MGKISLNDIVTLPAFEEAGDLFYRATGMTISFYDENGKVVFYPAEERCDLCHLIQNNPIGKERCQRSDREAAERALRTGKAIAYTCHAGMTDVVVPVVVAGERIGCFHSGQSLDTPQTSMGYQDVRNRLSDLNLDSEVLWDAYNKVSVVDSRKLDVAMGLMSIICNHLVEGEIAIRQERALTREQRKLRKAAEEMVRLERDLREMELKLLQAQVNPHFLFNALNLILGQSMAESASETAHLVGELATVLRASLSSVGSMVTLMDEIENSRAYVQIFQARFGHEIDFRSHIPEDLRAFTVPSLILQPLVENALIHGFPKCENTFHLQIEAVPHDGYMEIIVMDNGPAMTKKSVSDINASLKRNDHESKLTGLAGVSRRLKYYYPKFGEVRVASDMNGFRVSLIIPMR